MNQYERIVSYIYQYEKEEKGVNAGYAKLEKRGNQCRFSVQIRAVALKEIPKVYFYRQLSEGIQTIYAGSMVFRGNNMIWKASAEADRLFQSDWNLEEVDGIFIDGADKIYFATSWKLDRFYLGNWKGYSTGVDNGAEKVAAELVQSDVQADMEKDLQQNSIENDVKNNMPQNNAESDIKSVVLQNNEESDIKNAVLQNDAENDIRSAVPQNSAENDIKNGMPQDSAEDDNINMVSQNSAENNIQNTGEDLQNEIQMQSICGVCPFKRKVYDYGKKLLMTFPSMKPFQDGIAKACVRMELQDIGCLPITTWSLSGNRFLLHGYYCYRHLLFAQLSNGKYVLGVPGVFSEKERQNALRFGFSDFQSIGEFGRQQGAFGYWFLELPKSNA